MLDNGLGGLTDVAVLYDQSSPAHNGGPTVVLYLYCLVGGRIIEEHTHTRGYESTCLTHVAGTPARSAPRANTFLDVASEGVPCALLCEFVEPDSFVVLLTG